ncbi:MAG: carboxypeptidase regulatory-like domain-containing protein, partial [Candidatus Dadabacteria bacterium]
MGTELRKVLFGLAGIALIGCNDVTSGLTDPTGTFLSSASIEPVAMTGLVRLEHLGACAGVQLSLTGPDGVRTVTSTTDGFEITDVTPGAWRVTATVPGYTPLEQIVVVAGGEDVDTGELLLMSESVTVEGSAALADGQPAGGALAEFDATFAVTAPDGLDCSSGGGEQTTSIEAIVNGDGRYRARVPRSVRRVRGRVQRPGYTAYAFDVAVTATDGRASIPAGTLYPLTGFINVVGGAIQNTTTVTVQVSGFNGVSEMRLGELDSDGTCATGAWQPFAAVTTVALSTGDGPRTICGELRNPLGQRFGGLRAEVDLDTGAPTGSLLVANGALATAVSSVSLQLQATDDGVGVASVQIAQSLAALAGATVQPFEPTKLWTLDSGGAPQTSVTVWARYIDRAGNVGLPVSDSIVYDIAAPVSVTFLVNGSPPDCGTPPAINNAIVSLSIFASDGAEGSGIAEMKIAEVGLFDSINWEPFLGTAILPLSTNNGSKTFGIQVRDAAGNKSQSANGCVVLDTVPPVVQVLSAAGAGSVDGFSTSSNVTLTLSVLDNLTLSGNPSVCVDGDVAGGADCVAGSGWQTLAGGTLAVSLLPGEGIRTLNIYARDDAGNVSLPVVRTIRVDTTPPQTVPLVSAVGGLGRIALSWGAVTDADHYLVYYDTVDGAVSTLDGSDLEQGPSPIEVHGTQITLTGVRGMLPYFFRIVAVDAAGNVGADPGSSTIGKAGFIEIDGLTNGAGSGGLAATFDGRGDFWFAFKSNTDAVLAHCIDDCDSTFDITQSFRPLGSLEPAGEMELASTHDKLLFAYPSVATNVILFGACDQVATGSRCDESLTAWNHSSRTTQQSYVVQLPAGLGPAVTVPISLAVDDDSNAWLAMGRIDDGAGSESLRLFQCRLHQGRCSSLSAWRSVEITSAVGNVATVVSVAVEQGLLWVAWHQSADNNIYLATCDAQVADCFNPASWNRTPLNVSVTPGGQDPGPTYHRLSLWVTQDRAALRLHSDLDPRPGYATGVEHLLVCEAATMTSCRSASNWTAVLDGTSQYGDGDLYATPDRLSVFYVSSSQHAVLARTCLANCQNPGSWSLGTLEQGPGINGALIRAAGFAGGSISLVDVGFGSPWSILRPLLYPADLQTPLLGADTIELVWGTDPLATGYRIEVTGAGVATSIEIDDPGASEFYLTVQGGESYTTALRSRSTVGESDAGRRFQIEAPHTLTTLPYQSASGARDYAKWFDMQRAGSAMLRLGVDGAGDALAQYCPASCDTSGAWSGGAIWSPPTDGEIRYWDLTTTPAGTFFAAVRVTFPVAGTSAIWGLECASDCGQAASWQAGPIRLPAGDAPGLKFSLVADDRQLWLAHIIDQQPVGAAEHYGDLELMRCSLVNACTKAANWTALNLEAPSDPYVEESDVVLAVTSQAVYAAVVERDGMTGRWPLMFHECRHPGDGGSCGTLNAAWAATTIADADAGFYRGSWPSWS